MATPRHTAVAVRLLVSALVLTGCGSGDDSAAHGGHTPVASPTAPVLQPGRPGEPNTSLTGSLAAPSPTRRVDPDDVAFLTDMIAHHAQAIQMVSVSRAHLTDAQVRSMAARIEAAQRPEIDAMARWLREHGQRLPPEAANPMFGADADHPHQSMPGMASPAQLRRLGEARGAEADMLFLRLMITHHGGAVEMAREQRRDGADDLVTELSDDISVTQRVEIDRMSKMLTRLGG